MHVQDEWKLTPRITLNVGLRYDLQFLETINTDTNNISPRLGVAWSPFDSRRTLIRGSAGLFFDRVPMRALANALLSAGNTTDLGNLRQIGVSLSPTQVGAPSFPNILQDVVPSVTPVNLTTMDRDLQNAYSRQASVEVEQQLGAARDDQRGLPVSARVEPAHVDQSERADLRRVRHEQWLPAESELRQQQPVLGRWGIELSRPARLLGAATGSMGTLSGLIHLVEVDEQRRGVLLQLADRSIRSLEGLGSLRRRSAASARDQWRSPNNERSRRHR